MTTHIRIGMDDKRKLEQLADLEGISVREALSNAIAFYQLSLMKTWLKNGNFEWTPEMIEAFQKAREWLERIGRMNKRKLKESTKVKKVE